MEEGLWELEVVWGGSCQSLEHAPIGCKCAESEVIIPVGGVELRSTWYLRGGGTGERDRRGA
eukprot:4488361-Prymnesium_polylepis.1